LLDQRSPKGPGLEKPALLHQLAIRAKLGAGYPLPQVRRQRFQLTPKYVEGRLSVRQEEDQKDSPPKDKRAARKKYDHRGA
jgi:hypothetical protein